MAEAVESSSTAAVVLVVLVVGIMRHLARLAGEESEIAERESLLAYYSELFPGVVHAAEVPEALMWAPPTAVSAREEELAEAPQLGPREVCAVCFRPTTFRYKQCKAVKY